MAKQMHNTPMLDQLESGPWPSFITGLKRLAQDNDMMVDLLGQLEHSYETRKGYWKGGTVGVFGYGGGIIPRFSEVASKFPASAEFHTLRIQPPAGMHYTTGLLREMCDVWEKHGSGLVAFHGQSGDIMFQGITTDKVQAAFDEFNEMGFDLGVPVLRCEPVCRVLVTRVVSNRVTTLHVPIARLLIPFWTICIVLPCLISSNLNSRVAPMIA